jgi:hypothetical protein
MSQLVKVISCKDWMAVWFWLSISRMERRADRCLSPALRGHACCRLSTDRRPAVFGQAALMREESRGPHCRTDFASPDDTRFGRPMVARMRNGRLAFEFHSLKWNELAAHPFQARTRQSHLFAASGFLCADAERLWTHWRKRTLSRAFNTGEASRRGDSSIRREGGEAGSEDPRARLRSPCPICYICHSSRLLPERSSRFEPGPFPSPSHKQ